MLPDNVSFSIFNNGQRTMHVWLYSHKFLAMWLEHIAISSRSYHFQASTMAREPCMYGYIATNSWLCGWTIQPFLVGAIWPCNLGYIVTSYIARNTWLYSCRAIQPCIIGYIAMYTWLYSSQLDSHVYMAIQPTAIQHLNSLQILPRCHTVTLIFNAVFIVC